MKILMVCLGNICRSPLAEGILQDKVQKAGLHWQVESAGTNRYHIGEAPHPLSQKIARAHGLDISQQRAQKFLAKDFDTYDKIYALAEDVLSDMKSIAGKYFQSNKVDLLLNELYPASNRDVPDPFYGNEEGYRRAYELIDQACDAIIQKYGNPVKNLKNKVTQ